MRVKVRSDKAAAGDNQNVFLTARRWKGRTEYRGQFRFTAAGQVWMQASRVIQNVSTSLGANTRQVGATHQAGRDLWLRVQVTGTGPTAIRMKAWNVGDAEPVSWGYTVSDSAPDLQRAGSVGLLVYLGPNASNAPVTVTVDDYQVTDLAAAPPPPPPPPDPPVADFTASQTPGTLTVRFTDTSSGGPTGWNWDLGDGATSGQQHPSHTYAAPGDYTVRLTATNGGGSDSVTKTVTVSPPPPVTTHVVDTFGRTVTDGWGSAETGGAYALVGTAGNFAVTGTTGTMLVSTSQSRGALLPSVATRDVRLGFSAASDKVPTGYGQFVYAVARRTASGAEYRIRLRFAPNGQVYVGASRIVGGAETLLGPDVAAGVAHVPGQAVGLRAEIEGASPTTVRVRAWPASGAEPTGWAFTASDGTAELQGSGSVGIRTYLPSNTTNAPVRFTFDDHTVTAP
jgi:PKD repeat protein